MGYKIRVDVDTRREDWSDLSGVAISLYEENNAAAIGNGVTDNLGDLQINVDRANDNANGPTLLKITATKTGYKPHSSLCQAVDLVADGQVNRTNLKVGPIMVLDAEVLPPPGTDDPPPDPFHNLP